MPNDDDGNAEVGKPKPGPGMGQGQKKLWQAGPQARLAVQHGSGQPARALTQPVLPPALPAGTATQLELLLAMHTHRKRRFLRHLGIFVLIPSLFVWIYTALIATPRYVCTYEITYQSYQPNATLSGGLTQSIFGSTVTDSVDYGALLYEYIRSPGLAAQVDAKLNLRGHFTDRRIDWFSRLGKNATQAQFLAYWQRHVAVSEGFGGYLTITVQGFDPAFTLLLAQTINADADTMMDGLTAHARNAEVSAATQQLALASTALNKANESLLNFRNTHGDLDPNFVATQLATIEGTLESQLANARAQLAQAQGNLQPNSSQIVQLNLQVSALENQIQAERQRLADSNGQNSYSNTISDYQTILANQQLASTTYQSAQQGLVIAQADAGQKQNYVVDFIVPMLPDRPTAPDPLKDTLTSMLVCLCIYGIGNLLFAAFRDQMGI